ncbi:hypothetical protein B9Z19DRAFT_1063209 [Tuber borchii]|uniref:Uncharacterized protein n=1 Tax=Tuber borchii TaxID=42251 RepID=A0A2T6ZZ40_TUBBO|nr:hypothetical protein B9Z19DRAFT_1063209 [Tuber borchii]
MGKFKPEPPSSPDSPPTRRAIKRSRRFHEQRSRSLIEPVLARNTPRGEARPSLPAKFRRVHHGHSQDRDEGQRNRSYSQADSDDSDDSDDSEDESGEDETSDEPPEPPGPPRRRPRAQSGLHKGNTERYVMTIAKYSPAAAIPRTTSSKRKDGTEKRTLHRFTNEEHRFIWFYRNDLQCSRGDTYVHFNEYFGLHIRKDSIANTYERLRQKRPAEICDFQHTEPWAVGEKYDENTARQVATLTIEDTEDDTAGEDSYSDSTDEDMSTPALAGREQEFVSRGRAYSKRQNTHQTQPARNKTQSRGRTHIGGGGERRIKKSKSKHRKHRKNRTSILASDSSSPELEVKRRSSYQVNEKESPVSDPHASSPQIKKASKKRKVEFAIDSDSSENGHEVVKRRRKHRDYH